MEIEKKDSSKLYDAVLTYIKEFCVELFGIPINKIDETISLEEYGIDSMMVNEFNEQLAKIVPGLSMTVLFEYRNLKELTNMLVREYSNQLEGRFMTDKKENPKDKLEEIQTKTNINYKDCGKIDSQVKWKKLYPIQNSKVDTITKLPVEEQDFAIIGLSGKYPQAETPYELYRNCYEKKDCIQEIPKERWDYHNYFDPDYDNVKAGKMYGVWGGFLNNVDKFDPLFFQISPYEAELIDPQERMFLEVAWEVLEDAGYTRKSLREKQEEENSANVGVFVATTTQTYQLWGAGELVKDNPVLPNANAWSVANRISYQFNFTGPSMPVDTSCSSGLTAIHMACKSIADGECSAAIVGGVNIYLHPLKYIAMSHKKMLSPSGKCCAFGEDANGMVPGEGVGAVLIKPYIKAIQDHDHIYGIIKGSSINHDGKTNGYTVPNLNAQCDVIDQTLRKSRINPETISYIEAHGTGTKLGDPIEINAATKAYRRFSDKANYCAVGSVKSNIGHLESAAGIAALTKVLMMMKYKKLLPSIHAENKNPNINFSATPFYINEEVRNWDHIVVNGKECKRRAGISAFGAGGTNAHIILEEQEEDRILTNRKDAYLIVLSARDEIQLKEYFKAMLDVVKNHSDICIDDFAYTLQVGREAMEERCAFVVHNRAELIEQFEKLVSGIWDGVFHAHMNRRYDITSKELPRSDIFEKGPFDTKEFLERIAQLYTHGEDIEWTGLYKDNIPYRMSLPTYPFKKESYFVSLKSDNRLDDEEVQKIDRIIKKRYQGEKIEEFQTDVVKQHKDVKCDKEAILQSIITCISKVLKLEEKKISVDTPFMELGVDSILGFNVVSMINDIYDLDLKETTLFDYSDINNLADYIVDMLHKDSKETSVDTEDDLLAIFKKLERHEITVDNAKLHLEG